jgi:hypothetical protein
MFSLAIMLVGYNGRKLCSSLLVGSNVLLLSLAYLHKRTSI